MGYRGCVQMVTGLVLSRAFVFMHLDGIRIEILDPVPRGTVSVPNAEELRLSKHLSLVTTA